MVIRIDFNKAKDIAHNLRRDAREKELAPLDEAIAKRIPGKGDLDELENARQKIRVKYEDIQKSIDLAEDIDALRAVIEGL